MSQVLDQLGVVWISPDFHNMFKGMLQHLDPASFRIVIQDEGNEDYIEPIERLCQEQGYNCCLCSEVVRTGMRFRYLLSTQYSKRDDFSYNRKLGLKHIRYVYGLGFDQWHFAQWNQYYDLILCYGRYQVEKLDFCKDSMKIEVGYPRYDPFFHMTAKRGPMLKAFNCNPRKKTVLWLTTYKELCSIDLYADALQPLTKNYNVIVKPHPFTPRGEAERMELLHKQGFNYVVEEVHHDLAELFYLADYVICDYGGTAFGALYTDRNLLFLNVPGADDHHEVGSESSEYILRNVMPNLWPEDASSIEEKLANKTLWEEQKQVRHKLRNQFFAPYYGFSSRVSASVLRSLDILLPTDSD